MLQKTAICMLIAGVVLCGCIMTPPENTGSVQVTSSPSGAEVYLENEYRGTTPTTINNVLPGTRVIEIRERGYETWRTSIAVTRDDTTFVSTTLLPVQPPVPVTFPAVIPTVMKKDIPQIHIDGYWTRLETGSLANPASLLVHVEAANVGYADAREVTVSANLYSEGRQLCWSRVFLGTIRAGGHVTKDTMMSCTLPSGSNSQTATIRFENVVVIP